MANVENSYFVALLQIWIIWPQNQHSLPNDILSAIHNLFITKVNVEKSTENSSQKTLMKEALEEPLDRFKGYPFKKSASIEEGLERIHKTLIECSYQNV